VHPLEPRIERVVRLVVLVALDAPVAHLGSLYSVVPESGSCPICL
jgi:hypothetical protein